MPILTEPSGPLSLTRFQSDVETRIPLVADVAVKLHGMCEVCKENWHPPVYSTCFDCSDVKLCEYCEENYHGKEYGQCYDCHHANIA